MVLREHAINIKPSVANDNNISEPFKGHVCVWHVCSSALVTLDKFKLYNTNCIKKRERERERERERVLT